jgi:Holliday junction resolvase
VSTPESKTKNAIKKWLDARSIWYYMPVSNGMGRHGIPDFVCCWAGKFLAIEAKAAGKRANTSALQDREIAAIRQAKGWAVVVDDVAQLDEYFADVIC